MAVNQREVLSVADTTESVRIDTGRLAKLERLIEETSGYPAPKRKALFDQLMDQEIGKLEKVKAGKQRAKSA